MPSESSFVRILPVCVIGKYFGFVQGNNTSFERFIDHPISPLPMRMFRRANRQSIQGSFILGDCARQRVKEEDIRTRSPRATLYSKLLLRDRQTHLHHLEDKRRDR